MLVPNGMDGVGGLTQPQIKPGQTFVYEFAVRKSGSFMYHLHADEMVQAAIDHRHALKLGAKVGLRVLRW
jgi:manganese oxidase